MATTKVSQLTELTSAADDDLFLVADVSTNQSKKITKANLGISDENFTSALKTKLDGIEANADVTDTTNVVASLTAGTNITIAGDGTISATDTDTGILNVVEDTTPQLGGDLDTNGNAITGSTVAINGSNGEFMISATENGPVALRYDNNLKLTTKSDGVDITGELQADSLDIDGDGDITGNLTLGGNLNLGDDDKAQFGAGSDLQIYHNSSNNRSFIVENGDSDLYIQANDLRLVNSDSSAFYAYFVNGGSASLYHNNSAKLATTSTGIDVTGTVTTDTARSADVVDNDGSFDLDAGTNFTCTPTGNITLTFTNIPDGQSGTIVLVNTGGHTISAASTTKVMGADMLTTITTAGTYVIGYISDGTNVRVYNSLAQQ